MQHKHVFSDRESAGAQLATAIADRNIEPDLDLAIPRGGLPLGRATADRLNVPLDIIAAKKLGAPHNDELAIGAAASDGSFYRNDRLIEQLDISEEYIADEHQHAARTAQEKEETYQSWESPSLAEKRIVIVDDGIATGATAIACARKAAAAGAAAVIIAVPVGPPDALDTLAQEANTVVCLQQPQPFGAVGNHYRDFSQVTDEEAIAYLNP